MTQPDHDYSQYDLEQLYELETQFDRRRYPHRYAALQRAIAQKEAAQLSAQFHPPCFLLLLLGADHARVDYPHSRALKIARLVVSLQYGALALAFAAAGLISFFQLFPKLLISGVVIYVLFSCGVAILKRGLLSITDQAAVELWSLVAVGIAPFSAAFYTLGFALVTGLFDFSSGFATLSLPLLLVPLAGFYTPFVLAVLWVKYHHRTDEF